MKWIVRSQYKEQACLNMPLILYIIYALNVDPSIILTKVFFKNIYYMNNILSPKISDAKKMR